jgi:hypothetical protein
MSIYYKTSLERREFSRKQRQQARLFWSVLVVSILVGFIIITEQVTVGQWRVDMRAPMRVTPSGAVTTIRYGSINTFRPNTRLLPSENRYMRSARGLLPSEDRYRRRGAGGLPSAGRTASTLGTIRYGTGRFSPSVHQSRRIVHAPTGATSPLQKYLSSPDVHTYTSPSLMSGTIRYGTTTTSVSRKLSPQTKIPGQPGLKVTPSARKYAKTTGTSGAIFNRQALGHKYGSIRYDSPSPTMPRVSGRGFVPRI